MEFNIVGDGRVILVRGDWRAARRSEGSLEVEEYVSGSRRIGFGSDGEDNVATTVGERPPSEDNIRVVQSATGDKTDLRSGFADPFKHCVDVQTVVVEVAANEVVTAQTGEPDEWSCCRRCRSRHSP